MFPIRDTIPSLRLPVVTVLLIAVNAVAFFVELGAGRELQPMLLTYGLVPAREIERFATAPWNLAGWLGPALSSMFLHGGWAHVIGNLWFLWIFGDNVEDRFGRPRFLAFYLFCGLVAALVQVLFSPGSRVPMIGASGAISGVLGAYMVLYPRARIVTFFPIFLFPYFFRIRAPFFLGVWFIQQLWAGGVSLGAGSTGGVAWWAHAGGFVAGAAIALSLPRRRPPPRRVDILDHHPYFEGRRRP